MINVMLLGWEGDEIHRSADELRRVIVDILDDDLQYPGGLLRRRALIAGHQDQSVQRFRFAIQSRFRRNNTRYSI